MTKYLSDEGRTLFETVNLMCICCVIGLFGISANCINIIIFYKQGFKNAVNIGFFGLAISDIICLLTLETAGIFLNPLFIYSGIHWFPLETYYLLAAWPHVCFSRITSCITVYVTSERYLSIALPLKVKEIITPRTSMLIICLIYFLNIITLIPEYATSYLGWRFVSEKNETLIGIIFTQNRKGVEGVVYVLHFTLGIISFVGVVAFTSLLVIKLKQSSQWRKEVTSSCSNRSTISSKETKMVKMVVFIASILIICYSPSALISLSTFIAGPEYTIRGSYANLCEALWTTAYIFHSVNSSVNIFVYYSMSSKYRETFSEVFIVCRHHTR